MMLQHERLIAIRGIVFNANSTLSGEIEIAAGTWRYRFKDEDKAFIESASFFFLATADPDGRPDCSF